MAHTPGPWEWDGALIGNRGECPIKKRHWPGDDRCTCASVVDSTLVEYNQDGLDIPNEADWDLIAAAPDLLAALQDVVATIDGIPLGTANHEAFATITSLVDRLRPAIAKAEGR